MDSLNPLFCRAKSTLNLLQKQKTKPGLGLIDLEEQLNVTISDHLSQRMFRRSSHYSFDFNARVSDHIVFILIMFTVTSS